MDFIVSPSIPFPSIFSAPPQNLWVIDVSLTHFCPKNSAFIGFLSPGLFRIDIFQAFFSDKNYHH
ncbi:hypothetical protein ACFLQR_03995, partial [Verrucomicrobiota bacterium]